MICDAIGTPPIISVFGAYIAQLASPSMDTTFPQRMETATVIFENSLFPAVLVALLRSKKVRQIELKAGQVVLLEK